METLAPEELVLFTDSYEKIAFRAANGEIFNSTISSLGITVPVV